MISEKLTGAVGRKLPWLAGPAASHFPGSAEEIRVIVYAAGEVSRKLSEEGRGGAAHRLGKCAEEGGEAGYELA